MKMNNWFNRTIDKLVTRIGGIYNSDSLNPISETTNTQSLMEESGHQISKSRNGWHHTEETKRKIGDGNRGKHYTEETRRKISDVHRGMHHTEETRRRISEARRGKRHSEETRRKMSVGHTPVSDIVYQNSLLGYQLVVNGNEHKSIAEVSREYNLSYMSVWNHLKKYNDLSPFGLRLDYISDSIVKKRAQVEADSSSTLS